MREKITNKFHYFKIIISFNQYIIYSIYSMYKYILTEITSSQVRLRAFKQSCKSLRSRMIEMDLNGLGANWLVLCLLAYCRGKLNHVQVGVNIYVWLRIVHKTAPLNYMHFIKPAECVAFIFFNSPPLSPLIISITATV